MTGKEETFRFVIDDRRDQPPQAKIARGLSMLFDGFAELCDKANDDDVPGDASNSPTPDGAPSVSGQGEQAPDKPA